MRVVIDTNILVSAILTPGGPSHQVVQLVLRGDLQLCIDNRIVAEYREVLTRGKFSFSPKWVDEFLAALLESAQEVLSEPISARLLDETDRPFIEVAVAGRVSALVTGNVKHFSIAEKLGIPVKSPSEFLWWWTQR